MTMLSLTERVQIRAPAARVWRALTTPAELYEWYAPGCRWEIDGLTPGARLRFYNTETDVQTATIEEAVPPRRLTLRWHPDVNYPTFSILNVVTLAAEGDMTTVTLMQSGYEGLTKGVRDVWMEQDRNALASIGKSLKAYVERPSPLTSTT